MGITNLKSDQIQYLSDIYYNNRLIVTNSSKYIILPDYDSNTIASFLKTLKETKDYLVIIEYISSKLYYDTKNPTITLTKPLVIRKDIDPRSLENFIDKKIELVFDSYYLDDSFLSKWGDIDGPAIKIEYTEIDHLSVVIPIKCTSEVI
uniref:Uncharacterized protein n=1 Tax=Lactifluus volemus TaxID=71967 RepID=A0A2Z4M8T5_9AGAM|nr:hypothetical protein [Lactifluus volemus]AWX52884.1 hypothetical protein [Lactifluus volemus]